MFHYVLSLTKTGFMAVYYLSKNIGLNIDVEQRPDLVESGRTQEASLN